MTRAKHHMNGEKISTLRIGSRGSDLALWQANHVKASLGGQSEIVIIKTAGDRIQHLSLDKVEGKGFFTKELESALLSGAVDLAVHSFKDLPIECPPGLSIAAVSTRENPIDMLVASSGAIDLGQGDLIPLRPSARVGTSSLRRKAQLLAARPDLDLVDIRGNVPTRLRRASATDLDAVILARAGLSRLGLLPVDGSQAISGQHFFELPRESFCPPPAQGALALQCRSDDKATTEALRTLHCEHTSLCVAAERRLLGFFGGGCHLPLGALARPVDHGIRLFAQVVSPDGSTNINASATGSDAERVADAVHHQLVSLGADRIIASLDSRLE